MHFLEQNIRGKWSSICSPLKNHESLAHSCNIYTRDLPVMYARSLRGIWYVFHRLVVLHCVAIMTLNFTGASLVALSVFN